MGKESGRLTRERKKVRVLKYSLGLELDKLLALSKSNDSCRLGRVVVDVLVR